MCIGVHASCCLAGENAGAQPSGGPHRPLKTTLSTAKLLRTSYKHAPGAEQAAALVAVRIVQLLAGAAVEAEQPAAALSGQQLARRAAVSLPHSGVLTKIRNSAVRRLHMSARASSCNTGNARRPTGARLTLRCSRLKNSSLRTTE